MFQDAGILDRTHLRFFVADAAVKLLNDANNCYEGFDVRTAGT